MADYYLQIKIKGEEVKGESIDDKHLDWIEIDSISQSINQPASSTASQGGAKPEGRCHHSELSMSKSFDACSPALALACSAGKIVDEAIIECCRATGEKICYLTITLKNAFISNWSIGGSGDVPSESFGIDYTEIEWEYKQMDPGTFDEKTTIGHKWDLGKNVGE